ncbi:uncharacterized coiled-coil DUF342 family protein [Anoxybacillus tepidamans]|uniref:Uncharacterized coiled-coil DUF342 family protein n=1 Tax=Anoxybacteroides tepidamans TaxID=265948 RepID=A0A7W8IP31_9BACL|nr:hypothetical protein [Anoxybacillus tepidamans]MBB5323094.1 uncharacterized coiled-coil DUF342 family protein [Anoxybacillus tepidamans]
MQEQLLLQLVNLVQNLSEDMQWVKQEIQAMKQEMQTMKQEMQTMKQEIEALKQRIDKQEEEIYWLKVQMEENTQMIKAIRDNQLEQRSIQDAMRHEIAQIRREMATKEDIAYIHQRLDYQISRIARTEEELHLLKTAN